MTQMSKSRSTRFGTKIQRRYIRNKTNNNRTKEEKILPRSETFLKVNSIDIKQQHTETDEM